MVVTYGAQYDLFLYSAASATFTSLYSGVGRWGMNDRDAAGNVPVFAASGSRTAPDGVRWTVASDGTLVPGGTVDRPADFEPFAINNAGAVSGKTPGKGNASVVSVFSDQLEIVKNGRKDVLGFAIDINDTGDVALRDEPRIYTQQHGELDLSGLIHPDDLSAYTQDLYIHYVHSIGERNETGFFPILVYGYRSSADGGGSETFLLTPEATQN